MPNVPIEDKALWIMQCYVKPKTHPEVFMEGLEIIFDQPIYYGRYTVQRGG